MPIVSKGQFINSTTVTPGDRLDVLGSANNTTVMSSAAMHISSGGIADNTTVSSKGKLHISNGGVANNTKINSYGAIHISNGGVANGGSLGFEGSMYISNGGVANNMSSYYGDIYICSGGVASNTCNSNGVSMYISHGGLAKDTVFSGGGSMFVLSGGSARGVTVSKYGNVMVYSGGRVTDVVFGGSGSMSVANGGFAEQITVQSGGTLFFENGAGGSAITILKGGWIGAFSFNSDTTIGKVVQGSATLSPNVILTQSVAFVKSGGSADQINVSEGSIYVSKGGIITSAYADYYGNLYVSSGGCADSTYLNNGGMVVYTGGVANNTYNMETLSVKGGTVNNTSGGGTMKIYSGGVANNTVVAANQYKNTGLYISSGGVANNTIASGWVTVYSGGLAHDTVIHNGGGVYISKGGVLGGSTTIDYKGVVSAYAGGIVDFTVSEHSTTGGYLINDLSRITGTPTYTITTSAEQGTGTYKLAQGAENFNGTITLYVTGKEELYINVNGGVVEGNKHFKKYELLKDGSGNLTLTVSDRPRQEAPDAPTYTVSTTAWTGKAVTVTAAFDDISVLNEYSLDGENWKTYTAPVDMTSNGTVYFRSTNKDEVVSEIVSCSVNNIDADKPELIISGDDVSQWSKDGYKITVTASDSVSGLKSFEYSTDNVNWQNFDGELFVDANGKFFFRAIDNAGNEEVKSLNISRIDNTAPTLAVTGNPANWTSSNVTLKASVSDKGSGIRETRYSLDGESWTTGNKVTVSSNCTVYFEVTDKAGNVSKETVVVDKIDKGDVDLSIEGVPVEWTNNDVTVRLVVNNALSGIKKLEYSFDNKNFVSGTEFTVKENTTVYVRVETNLGAVNTTTVEIDKIDKVDPVISNVKADITMMTNKDVTVTADFSDNAELVAKEYSIDGGNWQTYTDSVVMTANGNITFRATDGAGNSVEKEYKVSNIKKEPPVTPEISVTTPAFVTTSVTITAVSDAPIEYSFDNKSFVKTFNRTSNITVTGNTTLYIRAVDSIGNVSETVEYEVTGIDSIADDVRSKYIFIKSSFSSKNTVGKKQDGVALKYLNNAFTKLSAVKADKREGASFVMLDSKITLNSSAALDGIDTLYGSAVQAVATEKNGTYTCKTTAAPRNTINVSAALADLDLVRFATINVTGAVGNVSGGKESLTETVKRSEKKGVVTENISYTKTVAASGKVTVTDAVAGDISGYSTVTLDNGVAGELVNSNVKITKSEKYIDGELNTSTITETYSASGTATLKNGSYVDSISGFKTVKLTASTVDEIVLGDSYTLKKGVETFKAAGSVTLENATVGSIVGMNKVTAAKGFNAIASYTGSDGNDTLTINKNAVLALGAVDMGAGAKDKFVNNGTLVLTCDFDRSFISGKGEIVAASDVYETLENQNGVLDLGATAEGFRTTKHENSDDTLKKAVKWDLKSGDYTGWLGSWQSGSDNVDFIKFTIGKNDVDKELSVSGVENFTLYDKKGNEVDIISAAGTYTLKLELDSSESTSYTLALA